LHVRGLLSGLLIAVLSNPGDCWAQQAPETQKPPQQTPQTQLLTIAVRPQQELAQTPPSPPQQQLALAQEPPTPQKPAPAQQGMGGIAGGVGAAPVYDEMKRPITAGGFVDKGPVVFEDVTKSAGLSGWSHKMGVPEKNFIVETNGSGVALIDYDNSGWLSIYLVNARAQGRPLSQQS
jgi:hypothetical protein